VVLVAFLVVNAPFIVWSPTAWVRGIFLPMVDPLVADGQGVVTFALHGLTGGVVLPWLSAGAALALVAMVIAFALWEARLKRAWLFLVPLVLFVPDRSLANYLLDFVPAALVAALSVTAVRSAVPGAEAGADAVAVGDPTARRWRRGLAVAVPALGSVALVAVAFSSAPLGITVDGVSVAGVATDDGGLNYRRVEVTVQNHSDAPLSPHFMISSGGGHPGPFWRATALRGTDPVGAGATTVFVLRPTAYVATPPHGQWWLVAAYTSSPNALSTSAPQYWRLGRPGP